MMISLDKENFQAEVKEYKGYMLIDYWSESCEPCKALTPGIEKLSEKYSDRIKFAALDVAKARRLAISEKVLGLPTICLYRDGEKIDEVVKDDATIGNIEAMIEKHL